jgi:uncharacterized BrkB/YihY/UPF0761 family membrane protein
MLALSATGHLIGTLTEYQWGTEIFVWSLTAVGFVFLVVFLHVLRIGRRDDRPVMVAATIATAAWVVLALGFGDAIGNILDFRALIHSGVSTALLLTTFLARGRRGAFV